MATSRRGSRDDVGRCARVGELRDDAGATRGDVGGRAPQGGLERAGQRRRPAKAVRSERRAARSHARPVAAAPRRAAVQPHRVAPQRGRAGVRACTRTREGSGAARGVRGRHVPRVLDACARGVPGHGARHRGRGHRRRRSPSRRRRDGRRHARHAHAVSPRVLPGARLHRRAGLSALHQGREHPRVEGPAERRDRRRRRGRHGRSPQARAWSRARAALTSSETLTPRRGP